MFDFQNQVVVVTGGTRGIGAAISEKFLQSGARVVATYVGQDEKAQTFKATLPEDQQERLTLRRFDVSSPSEVKAFFSFMDESFDRLDVLVNNSGIRRDGLAAAMAFEDWKRVLEVNLDGSFLMSQEAVLRMMKKRRGRIVMMSSIGGSLGLAGQANYAASKAAQTALVKVMSKEVAKRGITVNAIAPGFIETELLHDLDESLVEEYKKTVPLKRFGKAQEVAAAVCFLASEDAAYITGTTLEVAGGL